LGLWVIVVRGLRNRLQRVAFGFAGEFQAHPVPRGMNIASDLVVGNSGVLAMATQIVMDHTGDTRHTFDATDANALLKAEERFKELTLVGYTAAVRTAPGKAEIARTFDPTAEETLFFPRLIGG
jgi:hypothetical protein